MAITSTANFFPQISNKNLHQKHSTSRGNTSIFSPDQDIFMYSPVERHRNMSHV